MNDKIKELFKKAGGITITRNLMSNPVQVTEYNELWDDRIDRFAELIIQECSNFLKDELDDHFAAEQLVEHFGVE